MKWNAEDYRSAEDHAKNGDKLVRLPFFFYLILVQFTNPISISPLKAPYSVCFSDQVSYIFFIPSSNWPERQSQSPWSHSPNLVSITIDNSSKSPHQPYPSTIYFPKTSQIPINNPFYKVCILLILVLRRNRSLSHFPQPLPSKDQRGKATSVPY